MERSFASALLYLLAVLFSVSCKHEKRLTYDLNGEDWLVTSAISGIGEKNGYYSNNYPTTQAISAKVPGDIYCDLMRAGKLPDIFIGRNSQKTYDLPLKEWWYYKDFILPETFRNKRIILKFA
ncbi:MAG: hypothetical protein ABFD10_14640, partial [Prolixibacteraceae bacterium]